MQRLVLALLALGLVAGLVTLLWRGVRSERPSPGTELATSGPVARIAYVLLLGVIAYAAFLEPG